MSETAISLAKSRAIITSACRVLADAQKKAPAGGRELYASSADCYVLLHDATKLFCRCVSEKFGETAGHRWSPALPELLLSHPEKCDMTLALVEEKEFRELSFLQFVAA